MLEQDILREFLIESNENLNRLDSELIELEQRPNDKALLAGVFRTIHTIKGTCGFLGFPLLERIAHQAENLLSQLRSGERQLSERLVALILECVDGIRKILTNIEASQTEGPDVYAGLVERLTLARTSDPEAAGPAASAESRPAEPAAPEWLEVEAPDVGAVVVLAEPSPFLRGLVRGELEMAGHRVVEAATADEALSRMEGGTVNVVLAGVDLPPNGCGGLWEAMQQRATLAKIPVVALAGSTERIADAAGGFKECHTKFDRESMLASIQWLAEVLAGTKAVPAPPVESQA